MDTHSPAAAIGALADETRRALYDYVVGQPGEVSRDQAAAALDLPMHTVSFHLDRLATEGLLDVDFRRLSGRSGPGAGRPSKLYRRAERHVAVSLPDRRYDLVGRILARGVERAAGGTPLDDAIDEAAAETGRGLGSAAAPGDVTTFTGVLAEQGYEPRVEDDTVVLANCPFDALARDHTALVCGLNRSFVQGVADGLGCPVKARLAPEPGLCCVRSELS